MLRGLLDSLLCVVYPQECRVCSGNVRTLNYGVACCDCWESTKIFDGSEMLCNKCGAFFVNKEAAVPVYCRQCDDHLYDKAWAVGIYEKALSASVIDLKSSPHLPATLKTVIESALKRGSLIDFDLIIPIPLA